MRNFDYLREMPPLQALSELVREVYLAQGLDIPPRASLYELMAGESFTGYVREESLLQSARFVRKVGKLEEHGGHVTRKERACCDENLSRLLDALLPRLEGKNIIPLSFVPDYTEAETRRLFIDLMLKDAGWDVLEEKGAVMPGKACIEVVKDPKIANYPAHSKQIIQTSDKIGHFK